MADKDEDGEFDFLDDEEIDILFEEIVGMSGPEDTEDLLSDVAGSVSVYLNDGTTMRFSGIDCASLASVLVSVGAVILYDAEGKSCALFAHGVAAIVGSKA